MARHRLAALAAFAVVAAECAGGVPPSAIEPVADRADAPEEVVAAPALEDTAADGGTAPLEVPVPPPASAAGAARAPVASAESDSPSLPDEVDVVRPDVRVDGVDPEAAATASDLDGVRAAVVVGTAKVKASTPDGLKPLSALVVDVKDFRRFTPDVTANEVGVWQRLQEGDIVPTAAAANSLDAELGGSLTLQAGAGTDATRIGALAANGLPQLADVMLPSEVADGLLEDRGHSLLVAVAEDADVDGVMARVRDAVGGEAERLREPEQQQVSPESVGPVGTRTLESFSYQSFGDGTIRIDPDWVSRNIRTVTLPVLGRVTCHRAIIPQLSAALEDVRAAGLAGEIYQFSGCWVPRHILWDPSNSISNHAWGTAFDINVPTNQYGATPQMNRQIVRIFQEWGFAWGGNWSTPDGMHFELERLIDV